MKNSYSLILFAALVIVVGVVGLPGHEGGTVASAQDDMMDLPPSIEFLLGTFYGNTTGFEEYIHTEWKWIGNGELQFEGYQGFLNGVGFYDAVFSDLEVEVQHAVGQDDVWAIGFVLTATHTGDFPPLNIVATGNTFEFYVNGFIYLEDDMVKDCYMTWDNVTWFDALGMPYGSASEGEAN